MRTGTGTERTISAEGGEPGTDAPSDLYPMPVGMLADRSLRGLGPREGPGAL